VNRSVCILTTVHSPFDTRIFHKQARTLVRAGYDVTLLAEHMRTETIDGIRIIALPVPRNRLVRMFGLTWRAFRQALRQRADVYHFHDPELLPAGVLLRLLTRGKVIYDVHEDVPQQILSKTWLPHVLRRPTSFLFGQLEKAFSRCCHAVVPATEGVAAHLRHPELVVVHNYPDLKLIDTSEPAERNGEETSVVYIGGITRLRGATEMLDALRIAAERHPVRLNLIGSFHPERLEQEARKRPEWTHVSHFGWRPAPEVYGVLQAADVGLACLHPIPRHRVAMSVKLFEYMAAGIPVIASNFPLWREIVEGNRCGLNVDPLDPQAIAEGIRYVIEHPDEAREMGKRGRQAVEQKYNWETEAQELVALYERLLSE